MQIWATELKGGLVLSTTRSQINKKLSQILKKFESRDVAKLVLTIQRIIHKIYL